jgi:uncharacterized protein (TIGR03435 family)
VCGDAITYAEALVELERWRADTAALALTATGGPLLVRVRRILGLPSDDAPRLSGLVTLAGIIAIIVCLAGANYYLRAAQDPPHTPEVLSLMVNLDRAPRADEMPDVVRRLLEDRLNLTTRVERRNFPVLALVSAGDDGSLGPNVVRSTIDCFDFEDWVAAGQPPRQLPPAAPRQPVCGEKVHDSFGRQSYVAITMPQFADELRQIASWPTAPHQRPRDIVDRTGLAGRYDVDFNALFPAAALMTRFPMLTGAFDALGLQSLPRALDQQLGLKLEESEAPFDVIVIDSAERPLP